MVVVSGLALVHLVELAVVALVPHMEAELDTQLHQTPVAVVAVAHLVVPMVETVDLVSLSFATKLRASQLKFK